MDIARVPQLTHAGMTNAEKLRALRAEAIARGDCYVCRCRPAKLGRRNCQHCIDRARESRLKAAEAWRRAGLCPHCGKKPSPGRVHCDVHRLKANERNARKYHDAIERGLCTRCKRRLAVDRIHCVKCAAEWSAYVKARRERLITEGRCTICGKDATDGRMCHEHAEAQRRAVERYTRRRADRRAG